MQIILGHSDDLENKVTKDVSKMQLNTAASRDIYDCHLKDNVSVARPSVYVSMSSFTNRAYNYAHIPELNRYFFITDIILKNANTVQIDLRCDVLTSFQNIILDTKTLIERSQNVGNKYINDTMFPLSTKRNIKIRNIGQFDSTLKNYLVVTSGGVTNG